MVLLPGCRCCGSPCARPCPSIRYVAIRFQVAAASGNPIASSLPLTVNSPYSWEPPRSWTPPGILSTASSPEVDETLVVDLFSAPGFSVIGTYGRIDVTPLDDLFSPCRVTYRFEHVLSLGTWPRFRQDDGRLVVANRTVTETVTVTNLEFPWGMWDASEFRYKDTIKWDAFGTTSDPNKTRTITKQPPTFRECSGPSGWNVATNVVTGTAPDVGGNYVRPEPSGSGVFTTNVVPYFDTGPSYPPYNGNPYFAGESFASTLEWKRILPNPVVTITVS